MTRSDNIERFLAYTAMYLRQTEKDPGEINYQEIQKIMQQLDISSLQAGQDQSVTADLFQSAQVALCPPHHGIPPEADTRQPFQPADHVVSALYMRQLMRQDPPPLLFLHLVEQRRRNDDLHCPSGPPHHRRDTGGRRADRRDCAQQQGH